MSFLNKRLAGLLLILGCFQWVVSIIVAEARYIDYSISNNHLSDLGVHQGSAFIFAGSYVLLGLLITAAAYIIRKEFGNRFFTLLLILDGVGVIGVGLFNENYLLIHSIFALVHFALGAVVPIAAYRFLKSPFNYLSIMLGAFSLLAIPLFLAGLGLGIGTGGMELMIIYPPIMWLIAFGGYLIGESPFTAAT
jgi:hypothetical membrane protein